MEVHGQKGNKQRGKKGCSLSQRNNLHSWNALQTAGFWKGHIQPKKLEERIEISRKFMPQGFEAITLRLDGTHTPVNYDRKFLENSKDWWSYKLKRTGMNTLVSIFHHLLFESKRLIILIKY